MDQRKLTAAFILPALVWLCIGSVAAETRDVRDLSGFDSIAVGGGIDVTIRQGAEFAVVVVLDQDAAADVVTKVNGNVLEIGRNRARTGFFSWSGSARVNVTLPRLAAVTASGGADVDSDGTISGHALSITSSGGADIDLALDIDELEVEISGGVDADLSGKARMARMRSSGGSDLNAKGLEIDAADLRSSGGSDMSVTVRNSIVARASGGSDIVYAGHPAEVDVDADRSADITHRR